MHKLPMDFFKNYIANYQTNNWVYRTDKVFEYTKAPYELCVKESLKQAVLDMGVILDCKDIQLIPSAKYKGCFRVKPALTEEQVNMVKNYLDTYMEV